MTNSNNKKMEALIAALPKESLPTILPHAKERHDALKTVPRSTAPKEFKYDTWICQECGTQNTTQSSQCRKCGKYKTS
jgi:ribosomal protein L40E